MIEKKNIITIRNLLFSLVAGSLLLWNSAIGETGVVASLSCLALFPIIFLLLSDYFLEERCSYVLLSFATILLLLITICQCSSFNFYEPEYPMNQFNFWKVLIFNYLIFAAISLHSCGVKKALINSSINIVCLICCIFKLNIVGALIASFQLLFIVIYFTYTQYLKGNNTKNYTKKLSIAVVSSVIVFMFTYYVLIEVIKRTCHMYTYVEVSLLLSMFIIFGLIFTAYVMGKGLVFNTFTKTMVLFYFFATLIAIKIMAYLVNCQIFSNLPFNMGSLLGDLFQHNYWIFHVFRCTLIVVIILSYFGFYRKGQGFVSLFETSCLNKDDNENQIDARQ